MNSPDIFGWMSVNDASSVAVSAVMKAFLRVFSKMLLAELGFRLKSVFCHKGAPTFRRDETLPPLSAQQILIQLRRSYFLAS